MLLVMLTFGTGALGGLIAGFFIGKKHGARAAAAVAKIQATAKEL